MKIESHTETMIRLFLTVQEALWLKEYLRNSFVTNELEETSKMRQKFFDALTSLLTGDH